MKLNEFLRCLKASFDAEAITIWLLVLCLFGIAVVLYYSSK